jgi:hypothetical protein
MNKLVEGGFWTEQVFVARPDMMKEDERDAVRYPLQYVTECLGSSCV